MPCSAFIQICAQLRLRGLAVSIVTLTLTFLLSIPAFSVSQVFYEATTTPLSYQPQEVALGDLNDDGKLDMVITDETTNQISVLLGNGDGTFQAPAQFAVPNGPYGLVVADFNRDGMLDVAVTNYTSNTISILLGNGDGTLQAPVAYAADVLRNALAAADLNHDGKLDLAVAGFNGFVTVLLGNGDGTFGAPVSFATKAYASHSVVAADFNNDGSLDLAVDPVTVLLGNGDGTFGTPIISDMLGSQVTAADINRDGKLDIVSLNIGSSYYQRFIGQGNGSFLSDSTNSLPNESNFIALGDYDTNGKIDLLSSSYKNCWVSFTSGNGDGNFGNHQRQNYPVGCRPVALATGDLNGDGYLEAVVVSISANRGTNSYSVLLNGLANPQPRLSVPATLDFGSRFINTTTQEYVDLVNTGTATLDLTSITFASSSSALTLAHGYCGTTLAAGSACEELFSFTPVTRGSFSASLTIVDNATGSPQTVSITAVATALTPPPATLNFGTVKVGTAVTQSFTLVNEGGLPVSIGPFSITGVNKNDYSQTNTCGSSIVTGHPCTVTVTFTPAFPTNRNATLNIPNSGSGTNTIATTALTGKGY